MTAAERKEIQRKIDSVKYEHRGDRRVVASYEGVGFIGVYEGKVPQWSFRTIGGVRADLDLSFSVAIKEIWNLSPQDNFYGIPAQVGVERMVRQIDDKLVA